MSTLNEGDISADGLYEVKNGSWVRITAGGSPASQASVSALETSQNTQDAAINFRVTQTAFETAQAYNLTERDKLAPRADLADEVAARTAADLLKADKTELHDPLTLKTGSAGTLVGQELDIPAAPASSTKRRELILLKAVNNPSPKSETFIPTTTGIYRFVAGCNYFGSSNFIFRIGTTANGSQVFDGAGDRITVPHNPNWYDVSLTAGTTYHIGVVGGGDSSTRNFRIDVIEL